MYQKSLKYSWQNDLRKIRVLIKIDDTVVEVLVVVRQVF